MKARSGMTLVELVVAMTILSFVLLAMSGMFVMVSRRGTANEADLRRAAYLQQTASWLQAISFDSLSAKAKTDSVKLSGAWYVRRVTVADSAATRKFVTVRITPRSSGRPETMSFTRTKPTCTSVLNTGAGGC